METSGLGSSEPLAGIVSTSDINRNIETEKIKSRLLDNSCGECNIKFDSSKSLEVHLQYHNKNLYTKWSAQGVGSVDHSVPAPPPPAHLTTVTGVSAVESPASVAVASVVSSGVGPALSPAGSMQISMAQSMGIQQGAPPPHLTTHHNTHSGQSQAAPSLPSINTDVSEFFSQLENNSDPVPHHENLTLETFHIATASGTTTNGVTGADKNNRFHPYGVRQQPQSVQFPSSTTSAMSQASSPSVSVQSYQSYNSPFHESQVYSGPAGTDYLNFSEPHNHDQSSEEIWDLDSHCTVRRYNPGPDPVSPGPIPTTPTMYGQQMQQKAGWEQGSYSPYGAINRGQTPLPSQSLPPQSLSPGLASQWMGGMAGMKGAVQASDSKRPKSYQCEACDKWFTSSGHLKRHFNTTLHKNAMKQKGDGYIDGLNGGSFSIPSVESRGAPSPCMSLGEESSQSSVCEDSAQNIVSLNQPAATSLPDNSSPSSNTSPNVPTQSPLLSPGPLQDQDSPLNGLSHLAGLPPSTPQPPSTPGLLCSSSPNSNLNASPASHKNRFSPFRSGVGQPANNSNPSYKVQNLDQRQQQSYQHHPSYPNTFQSPSPVVSSHNFNNGDIYLSHQQNLSSAYHRPQLAQDQGYPGTAYTGQYHAQYQPIIYSSSYDMSNNHNNYLSHNNFNDISSYTPMPQDGLNSIFPEHVNSIRTVKKERNSPEGSEGSDSLNNELGEFRCNECNKVFQKICYLKQHNKSFHNGEKPFKCTQCGKRFPVELLYQVVSFSYFHHFVTIMPHLLITAPPQHHLLSCSVN